MGVSYDLVCDKRRERLGLGKLRASGFQGITDIDKDGEESFLLPAAPAIERFIADCVRNEGGKITEFRIVPDYGNDESENYMDVTFRYRPTVEYFVFPGN